MASQGGLSFAAPSSGIGTGAFNPLGASSGSGFNPSAASSGGFNPSAASLGGFNASAASSFGGTSAKPNNNLFTFGGASQFGSIGSAAPSGGVSSMFGGNATVSDDPYAKIDIDLSKVKTATKPAKPFEQKTEEEKQSEAAKRNPGQKSNLKTTSQDLNKDGKSKKGVTFGKSTTYQVAMDSDDSDYNINNVAKSGSPRPSKKVIEEKEIGDGQDEKEKIKELLEAEEKQRKEEAKLMEEWKKKQSEKHEKTAMDEMIDKIKKEYSKPKDSDSDDITESAISSSMSAAKKQTQVEESYTTDDFEDISMSASMSASKTGISSQIKKNVKSQESLRSSTSGLSSSRNQNQLNSGTKDSKSSDNIDESSSRYDEDFESLSKSQNQLNNLLEQQKKLASPSKKPLQQLNTKSSSLNTLTSLNSKPVSTGQLQSVGQASVVSKYVKKENKQTMTDLGKYHFMPNVGEPTNLTEWSLKKNLEDAELMIQELKTQQADDKEEIRNLELKMKQREMDYQTQRREALNATETNKRLEERLKESLHKINLYKIETEELIKQIDLADAKSREKEDELLIAQAEYDRKLKLQEERILYRKGKNEEREVFDVKREHAIQIDEVKKKLDEKQDEIEYLNQKVLKLEQTNRDLRLAKDPKQEIKKLEAEVAFLKTELETHQKHADIKRIDVSIIKKELSLEDQMRIQRELAQMDKLIKGYQDENERAEAKIRDLTDKLKKREKELKDEKVIAHEFQLKHMIDKNKVWVEEKEEEVTIQAANLMGPDRAFSAKQIKELQESVVKLREEKESMQRDFTIEQGKLESQIKRLSKEKEAVDKQLHGTEYLVSEKQKQLEEEKSQARSERIALENKIADLQEKIDWFRENQKIIAEQGSDMANMAKEIANLKGKIKQAEEDRHKARELEKRNKLLEETIKARNPNSIPMLIQAAADVKKAESDEPSKKQLQFRIQQLEGEIDDREKDFERRIRSLRQEQERMRQVYEQRATNPHEAMKVNELEAELQRTKQYYHKRIRELEDKYKFKVNIGSAPEGLSELDPKEKNQVKTKKQISKEEGLKAEIDSLKEKFSQLQDEKEEAIQKLNEDLDKTAQERNELARKLYDLRGKENAQTVNTQAERPLSSRVQPVAEQQSSRINILTSEQPPQPVQARPKINPFFLEEPSDNQISEMANQNRPVQTLLQILSKMNLRPLQGKQLRVAQLHKECQGIISLDEVRSLQGFLESQKDLDEATPEGGEHFIDMDELIEAVKIKAEADRLANIGKPDDKLASELEAQVEQLERKVKRIQREKDDDTDFFNSKIRQLKRQLTEAESQKRELEGQINKTEAQKTRLEQFFKQKLGIADAASASDTTFNKTMPVNGVKSNELFNEINYLLRRIEYLEEQSEERTKQVSGDHVTCRKEISRLTQELQDEKDSRTRVTSKKNAEIAYFKAELDALMAQLEQQNRRTKTTSIYN